jgi:plastocyanin
MSKGRSRSLTGVHAAIAAIAGTAVLGAVGAAGAGNAAEYPVRAIADDALWHPATLTVQTGDTVRWWFDGGFHNVKSTSPNWGFTSGTAPSTGSAPYTFTAEGDYTFVCEVHPFTMDGTITVQDEPVDPTPDPDPDPSPSPGPSPSPTPTPPPSGGGHVTTPAPTGGGDTVKPTVRNVSLTVKGRAVRVRFRLSERATVTVGIKRRSRVTKAARVQAAAGTRTVTLRSERLTKGRYTVEIRARDAYGNRSSLATKRLLVRR